MNIDQIKALADIFTANGLTLLEINEGDVRIRVEKYAPVPQKEAEAAPVKTFPQPTAAVPEAKPPEDKPVDFNNLFEVKSPLVGVFYAAPSPDSEPFTRIGARVKKGDVLCLVETMKLMNEIVSEREGEIVDICIKDGDIAEFGQVLFKIL